jgi:uncharacterized protein YdaU (DUF1376 family)
MNFYEHHIGDWARDAGHLSFIERGAYRSLLDRYYADERPLPSDIATVQRIIGARTTAEKNTVKHILQEFFTLENDGWHNKRADEEIAKYREKSSKAQRSARARWGERGIDSDADAMRTHSEGIAEASETHAIRNAHQSPVASSQTPVANTPLPPGGQETTESDADETPTPQGMRRPTFSRDQVDGIYNAYPRKVGRAKAIYAIERALVKIKNREDAPEDPVGWLLNRVLAYAESPAGNAGEFTPHPATWFNRGSYDDADSEWQRGATAPAIPPRSPFPNNGQPRPVKNTIAQGMALAAKDRELFNGK